MSENLNVIKGLDIKNFRGFQNQKLELGPYVTIIFGQNGTLKSTLLGMIAQPFYFSEGKSTLYTTDYQDSEENPLYEAQINNMPFESEYGKMFRMSETDHKAHEAAKYVYYIEIAGTNVKFSKDTSGFEKGLMVMSQFSTERKSRKRFRLVGGAPGHLQGTGNFPHPVIYLGLNRLYPLALSTFNERNSINLSADELEWFNDQYNFIFSLDKKQNEVSTSAPKQAKKGAYVLQSDERCNYKSASAGQDNVGQIISAALSFRRLKAKLGNAYRGGLLLIDEMDATLHPIAQKKMLDFLVTQSKELNIQVVTTSHSTVVLDEVFFSGLAQYVTAVTVTNVQNEYKFKIRTLGGDVSYSDVYCDLFHSFGEKLEKMPVLLEDSSAAALFRVLVGDKICKNIDEKSSVNDSASCEYLKWLSTYSAVCKRIPLLVILDGDQNLGKKQKSRAMTLIGGSYPERVLYDFFMQEYDWGNNPRKFAFDKQACFEDFREADRKCSSLHQNETVKEMHKRWYKAMAVPGRLGQSCTSGWRAYKAAHQVEAEAFVIKFLEMACEVLKDAPKEYRVLRNFFKTVCEQMKAPPVCAKTVSEEVSVSQPPVIEPARKVTSPRRKNARKALENEINQLEFSSLLDLK